MICLFLMGNLPISEKGFVRAESAEQQKKKKKMWNNDWKKSIDYPEWGDNDIYKKTISGGYLLHVNSA